VSDVISVDLARRLRDAGLRWTPTAGDRFVIPQPGLVDELFTLSDMTIEPHHYPTGTVLGFNGTTEWALDSVAQEDALWMPREDQLRELLGGTFRALVRDGPSHQVVVQMPGRPETSFTADDPAEAYGRALLALLVLAASDV